MVLFITCLTLDTSCTYDCIGTSGKKLPKPLERVLFYFVKYNLCNTKPSEINYTEMYVEYEILKNILNDIKAMSCLI